MTPPPEVYRVEWVPGTDHPLRVTRRVPAAEGVVHLYLEPVDGAPLPAWEPGAHVDLVVAEGLVRQYSLCGDPADTGAWQVAVQLAPDGGRGGSRAVFERLHPGREVTVRGPRNAFRLRPAPRYVFIAGGIGITPILPMIEHADRTGADWTLAYGGRTRAAMPFLDRLPARPGRVRVLPQDETGLLPVAELVGTPRPDTLVYCCGPQPLLEAVTGAMAGWPPDQLVIERFTPAPGAGPDAAGPDAAGPDAAGQAAGAAVGDAVAFDVELAGSGRVIRVGAGESVLAALERAGIPMLSSCREGTCGTCEVPVLSGRVDHRDRLLTEQERAANDTMLVCVSRSTGSRLVLDLSSY